MLKDWWWVLALAGVAAVVATVWAKARRSAAVERDGEWKAVEHPRATGAVLGKGAQSMYFRLLEAFPEYVVLAEVAFSALLSAKRQGTRNSFNRLRADFVVCDKAFKVIAVLELDDSTHDNADSREKDTARDVLLGGAGYRVLRYRGTPAVTRLRGDIVARS